ncbi:DUF5694 domain-containing protein [uncultured Croceitalea sp.]|uniref:DUF5694 domain-containing protein n=1 Tax=uncultured Croceitalea sp. TaxID=1798908 RepID=UPI0033059103
MNTQKTHKIITKAILFSSALILIILCGCINGDAKKEESKETKKIKVYLLGTFHFAQTDSAYNVLDKKHQKSIERLNDKIVGLAPDKIFIERMPDFEYQHKMDSVYSAYKNRDKDTNNPNEIWQVAFKVAKRLGHKKLYQCDHPGRYSSLYNQISAYAKENGQMSILNKSAKGTTRPFADTVDRDSLMQSMTLFDFLRWLNKPKVQNSSHAHYVNVFPQAGHIDVYNYKRDVYLLGTELTADWYRRNIYTYSKMINQLDYDEESIFLIIGNDHIPIIKHLFQSNPYFEVVSAQKWLN